MYGCGLANLSGLRAFVQSFDLTGYVQSSVSGQLLFKRVYVGRVEVTLQLGWEVAGKLPKRHIEKSHGRAVGLGC